MGRLDNLGAALRHLRLHGGPAPRKQLDVAERAGVTGAMLSNYERGEESPRIETLDRVLTALEADLVRLQWALDVVDASPGPPADRGADAPYPPPPPTPWEIREGTSGYRPIPLPGPLDEDEEEALGELVNGFLAWVRYTRKLRAPEEAEEECGGPAVEGRTRDGDEETKERRKGETEEEQRSPEAP